jgi:hypothetical protein
MTGATPTARETEILRAIHAGRTMDEILAFGAWTLNDVTATIRKFSLTVSENGKIEQAGDGTDSVIAIALRSPSQTVRNQALRAQALLKELRRHVAVAAAERADETARARARKSVEEWIAFLTSARQAARAELRNLNVNSKRSSEGKVSRGA